MPNFDLSMLSSQTSGGDEEGLTTTSTTPQLEGQQPTQTQQAMSSLPGMVSGSLGTNIVQAIASGDPKAVVENTPLFGKMLSPIFDIASIFGKLEQTPENERPKIGVDLIKSMYGTASADLAATMLRKVGEGGEFAVAAGMKAANFWSDGLQAASDRIAKTFPSWDFTFPGVGEENPLTPFADTLKHTYDEYQKETGLGTYRAKVLAAAHNESAGTVVGVALSNAGLGLRGMLAETLSDVALAYVGGGELKAATSLTGIVGMQSADAAASAYHETFAATKDMDQGLKAAAVTGTATAFMGYLGGRIFGAEEFGGQIAPKLLGSKATPQISSMTRENATKIILANLRVGAARTLANATQMTAIGAASQELLGQDGTDALAANFGVNLLFSLPFAEVVHLSQKGASIKLPELAGKPKDVNQFQGETQQNQIQNILYLHTLLKQNETARELRDSQLGTVTNDIRLEGLEKLGNQNLTKLVGNTEPTRMTTDAEVQQYFQDRYYPTWIEQTKNGKLVPPHKITVTDLDKMQDGKVFVLGDFSADSIAAVSRKIASSAPVELMTQLQQIHATMLKDSVRITEGLSEALGIKGPTILSYSTVFPDGAAASFQFKNRRYNTIQFDPKIFYRIEERSDGTFATMYDPTTFKEMMTHEMSHVFAKEFLERAPDSIELRKLQDTYFSSLAQSASPKDFTSKFGPSFAENVSTDRPYPLDSGHSGNELHVSKYAEWFANQMARSILLGNPESLPKSMRKLVTDYQHGLGKMFPLVAPGNDASMMGFLREQLTQAGIRKEEIAIKTGQRTETYLTPKSVSPLWQTFDQVTLFPEVETRPGEVAGRTNSVLVSDLQKAVGNENFPKADRRAMADTLSRMRLDRLPEGSLVDLSSIAKVYDQHLQFRAAEEHNYNSMSPLRQAISRVFNNDPKEPVLLEDLTNTGRAATWWNTLLQIRDLNPNNRYLKDHTDFAQGAAALRAAVMDDGQPVRVLLKNTPRQNQERIQNFWRLSADGTVSTAVRTLLEMTGGWTPEKLASLSHNKLLEMLTKIPTFQTEIKRFYNLADSDWDTILTVNDWMKKNVAHLRDVEMQSIENNPLIVDKALAKKTAQARYGTMNRDFYFPEMRFGHHMVTIKADKDVTIGGQEIKAGDTVLHEHYETQKERDDAIVGLSQAFPRGEFSIQPRTLNKRLRALAGLPFEFMAQSKRDLMKSLENNEKITPEVMREAESVMDDVTRAYANQNSFVKRQMLRRNVLGASNDVPRIVASYTESFANHLARLAYNHKIEDNFFQYENYLSSKYSDTRSAEEVQQKAKGDTLLNYMRKHHEYVTQPGQEFEGLKSFGFFMHLGLNAKSAFVNLTQLPLFAYPYLGRMWGDAPAFKELSQAMKDVVGSRISKTGEQSFSPLEAEIFTLLRRGGTLNIGSTREMASQAISGSLENVMVWSAGKVGIGAERIRPGARSVREGLHSMSNFGAAMFQHTENISRESTALAALRLAQKGGVTEKQQLYFLAKDAVERSMFTYDRYNRPAMFRGVTSPLFLFQQFTQNALYFATRKNTAAMRYAATMLAFAGISGLPGAEDAMDLADAMGKWGMKWTGRHKDFEVRNTLREMFEGAGVSSEFAMHGIGRNGLGLDHVFNAITGGGESHVDLSGSIGQGRVVPFGIPKAMQQIASGAKVDPASAIAQNVSGAAGDTVWKLINFLKGDEPDIWKRVEGVMPTAVAGLDKSIRQGVRGYETDRQGQQIQTWDVGNADDLAGLYEQALSFTPTEKVAIPRDVYNAARERQTYWMSQKTALMTKYAQTYQIGLQTPEPKMDEIRALTTEIMHYNDNAPPWAKISTQSLKANLRGRAKEQALRQAGFITGSKTIKMEEILPMFQDEQDENPDVTIH